VKRTRERHLARGWEGPRLTERKNGTIRIRSSHTGTERAALGVGVDHGEVTAARRLDVSGTVTSAPEGQELTCATYLEEEDAPPIFAMIAHRKSSFCSL